MTKQEYTQILRYLPQDIKQRLNDPDFLQGVDDLGDELLLPIYVLITKLIVGEIVFSELPQVLKQDYQCSRDVIDQCIGGLLILGVEEMVVDLADRVAQFSTDSQIQRVSQTILTATGGDLAQLV